MAYYGTELITILKSFKAQAHGSNDEGKKVLQQRQNEEIIFFPCLHIFKSAILK